MTSTVRRFFPASTRARGIGRLVALCGGITLLGLASACKSSTSPRSLLLEVGSFHLEAVSTSPLPYCNAGNCVVRGTLSVQANARYALTETDSTAAGLTQLVSNGTWQAPQGTIQFTDDNTGTLYLGTLSGSADSITVGVGTHFDVFVRN
jgi:hypothetical protein